MSSEVIAFESHPATENCPWCKNPISREEFQEIEARIAEQERNRLAAERSRMQLEIETYKRTLAATLKAEHEERLKTLNAEREEREAAIRQTAIIESETRVKSSMEGQITALVSERDTGLARLKQVEDAKIREASLRVDAEDRLTTYKAEAGKREDAIRKEVAAQTEATLRASTEEQREVFRQQLEAQATKVR